MTRTPVSIDLALAVGLHDLDGPITFGEFDGLDAVAARVAVVSDSPAQLLNSI